LNFRRYGRHGLSIDVEQGDVTPVARQLQGDGAADAGTSTGDQRTLAGQTVHVCARAGSYCAVQPPSSVRIDPVAKRLSSLARKRMPAAISSGVPSRPINWRCSRPWRIAAASGLLARISEKYGVSMVPGATALHLMPSPT